MNLFVGFACKPNNCFPIAIGSAYQISLEIYITTKQNF
jgi:hypothetical protein